GAVRLLEQGNLQLLLQLAELVSVEGGKEELLRHRTEERTEVPRQTCAGTDDVEGVAPPGPRRARRFEPGRDLGLRAPLGPAREHLRRRLREPRAIAVEVSARPDSDAHGNRLRTLVRQEQDHCA